MKYKIVLIIGIILVLLIGGIIFINKNNSGFNLLDKIKEKGIIEKSSVALSELAYTRVNFPLTNLASIGMTTNGTFIWVVQASTTIYKYYQNGTYTGSFFTCDATINNAKGITTNNTYLWITDGNNDEVYIYWMNGTYTQQHWDTAGSGNLDGTGITTDGIYFYISDFTNAEIYMYWFNGTFYRNWDTAGNVNKIPYTLTTDGIYLWTINYTSAGTIAGTYKWFINGTYNNYFNIKSSGIVNPKGMFLYGNLFYISDSSTDKVYIFSENSSFNLWITNPTTTNSLSVTSGNTYSVYFNFSLDNINITSGVSINSSFIGGINSSVVKPIVYINNIGWQVNVTAPTFASGLKDLKINASYNGVLVDDTETNSINYGIGGSSCTYTSGNWNILFSDYCNITSPVDVAGNSITISGSGIFTTTANITSWKTLNISGGNAYCFNGGCFR